MSDLDCPWCEGSLRLADDMTEVACDECSIRVELAADPVAERVALAA